MSEEPDKKQDHFHDFKKAVEDKTICQTCGHGSPPFLLQGPRLSATQPIPVAPVFVCENTGSPCYMAVRAALGSCPCWKKTEAAQQPKIVIAHKTVPPLKITDLKGEGK